MSRNFVILDYPKKGNHWGNFSGSTPLEAAHHAFRSLSDELGFIDPNDGQRYLVFTILEKNVKRNGRNYIGTWVTLHEPIKINHTKNEFITRRPVVTNWVKPMNETFIPENISSNNRYKK
jgi:hypothetical protein